MKISKNKVVAITYSLTTEQGGPVVDQATDDRPLEFLFGRGMLLEKFESYLDGLAEGDKTLSIFRLPRVMANTTLKWL